VKRRFTAYFCYGCGDRGNCLNEDIGDSANFKAGLGWNEAVMNFYWSGVIFKAFEALLLRLWPTFISIIYLALAITSSS